MDPRATIALHDRFGGDDRAAIIGHDWGAPIAYGAASHVPERWSRVVGTAVPPGGAIGHAFLTNTDQLKRGWYMFFFQSVLADMVVPADDLAFIDMIWRTGRPDTTLRPTWWRSRTRSVIRHI
jgi:pimeloyl-ACP methyl ester carboxylesterase